MLLRLWIVLDENDSTDRDGNIIFIYHPFDLVLYEIYQKGEIKGTKEGSKEFWEGGVSFGVRVIEL